MFEWPRFAEHLLSEQPPQRRVASLLAALVNPADPEPSLSEILAALPAPEELVADLKTQVDRLHHVGFLAPPGLDVAAAEKVVAETPFRDRRRTFKSAILAKDLSARLGRQVDLTVVMGFAAARTALWPAVEVFVSDLPAPVLEALLAREVGCHIAVELRSEGSFDRIVDYLNRHGYRAIPLMQGGPLTNGEIRSRVLYVDALSDGRTRRVEFIAPIPA